MKQLLTLIACCSLLTAGYGQSFEWNQQPASAVQQKSVDLSAYERAYNQRQVGTATVYPAGLDGNRTIFGETYNSRELTASHAILPLGTLVRVVNLDNNRNVTVRINDRGRECAACLLALSPAAATQLGIANSGRVSVERIGFSNWNPAPAVAATTAATNAYGNVTPAAYGPPATAAGVVRPVQIQGDAYGWQSKSPQMVSSPYGQPGTYAAEVAKLGNPRPGSVMTREVDPATRAGQPATYGYPATTIRPQYTNVAPPVYQPVNRPQAYGGTRTATVRPYQPAPVTAQTTVPTQAAPPGPTVVRYQEQRTVAAPPTYQLPAPATYQQTARSVQPYVPTATQAENPAPTSGYVVQLGAYNNELYASNRVNQLRAAGMTNVFYRAFNKADGQVINRVYAGTFPNMAAAQQEANQVRNTHGIAGIVTRL